MVLSIFAYLQYSTTFATMIIILSPSKTLDLSHSPINQDFSLPHFANDAKKLMLSLKKWSTKKLAKEMKLSDTLASTVKTWHESWDLFSPQAQTCTAMKGEAFKALDFPSLSKKAMNYSKDKLYVLSGIYGALAPFDGISPYRLEMAQKFQPFDKSKSLNGFWIKRLPSFFNSKAAESGGYLANLASDEYNKVVIKPELNLKVINFSFKVETDKGLKNISVFAKQARGAMARFILENQISTIDDLKNFDYQGYKFREDLSSPLLLSFTRTR